MLLVDPPRPKLSSPKLLHEHLTHKNGSTVNSLLPGTHKLSKTDPPKTMKTSKCIINEGSYHLPLGSG